MMMKKIMKKKKMKIFYKILMTKYKINFRNI